MDGNENVVVAEVFDKAFVKQWDPMHIWTEIRIHKEFWTVTLPQIAPLDVEIGEGYAN